MNKAQTDMLEFLRMGRDQSMKRDLQVLPIRNKESAYMQGLLRAYVVLLGEPCTFKEIEEVTKALQMDTMR